jgi:predicted nucleic acid-binding Zn ribbon protein
MVSCHSHTQPTQQSIQRKNTQHTHEMRLGLFLVLALVLLWVFWETRIAVAGLTNFVML